MPTLLDVDPLLNSSYQPQSATIDNQGQNLLTSVPDDIAGTARTTAPDPGALEFTPPTCLAPSVITGGSITNSSVQLNWTENSGATAWEVDFGSVGFTPGGLTTAVTSKPFTLTGLMANTTYEVYVKSVCGSSNKSSFAGPYTFTTLCDAVTAFPYTENFSTTGTNLPGCWSVEQVNGTGNWARRGSPIIVGTSTEYHHFCQWYRCFVV